MQENLLHQLNAPALFVCGELDQHCRPNVLQEACSTGRLPSHSSTRIVTLPVCHRSLCPPPIGHFCRASCQHKAPMCNTILLLRTGPGLLPSVSR